MKGKVQMDLWSIIVKKMLSYSRSHIYDIHMYIAALIVFIIIMLVKGKIKEYWKKKCGDNIRRYRMCNLTVALLAAVLGEIFLWLVSVISGMITPTPKMMILIITIPIGVYTLFEVFFYGFKGIIVEIITAVITLQINYYYCIKIVNTHYKFCYFVKVFLFIWGIFGILLQFIIPPEKKNKKADKMPTASS